MDIEILRAKADVVFVVVDGRVGRGRWEEVKSGFALRSDEEAAVLLLLRREEVHAGLK